MKHLFILQHGLWGAPGHVLHVRNTIIKKMHSDDDMSVHTYLVQNNKFIKTYSGIRECGRRLYNECKPIIEEIQPTHISFIGYSAGGLFVRYALSLFDQDGLFNSVVPMNLCLLCSPNAGTYRFEQQDYDIFPNVNIYNFAIETMPSFIGGKTAREFVFQDNYKYSVSSPRSEDKKYPLIHLMSLEPFVSTIRKFKTRRIYGNIYNDRAVGFRSGCLYPYKNPYDKYDGHNPLSATTKMYSKNIPGQYIGCKINLVNNKSGKTHAKQLKPITVDHPVVLKLDRPTSSWCLNAVRKICILTVLFTIVFPLLVMVVFPIWYLIARVFYYAETSPDATIAETKATQMYDLKRDANDALSLPERTLQIIHNLRDHGVFTETALCWLPGASSHGTLICRNYSKPWVPNARDGVSVVDDIVSGMLLK